METHANRLLGVLAPKALERLRPCLERVPLELGQALYRARKPVEFVYFVESGVVSLVTDEASGVTADLATVGNEGVVGLPLLLGDVETRMTAHIRVPGVGLRMKATQFKRELTRNASLQTVMLRYVHLFVYTVALSGLCHQFHSIEQRCCRWLLMTRDRMQSDGFAAKQEVIAMALGAQRTGVSVVAGSLRRAGLISYTRGNVHIIDRNGLENRACDCYRVSKFEFTRFLDQQARVSARD